MTSRVLSGARGALFRPVWRERALWAALIAGSSVLVGLLTAYAPLVAFGAVAAGAAAVVFSAWPLTLLFMVIAVRASLDVSGAFFSLGGTNLAGLVNAAVLFGGGLAIAFGIRRLPAARVSYPYLALLVLAAVSLAYTPALEEGFQVLVALGALFVVFVLSAVAVRSFRDLRRLVDVVMLSAVVPIAVALIQVAGGGTGAKKGVELSVSGTFTHPNGLSFFLLIVLAVALVSFLEARSLTRRVLVGALLVAGTAALVFTFSRSAWVGLVLVLILLAVARYRRLGIAVPIVAVATLLLLPGTANLVEGRFAELSPNSTAYSENSWQWRNKLWGAMLPLADDRPFGYGIGSFPTLTVEYLGVSPRLGILHREDGNYAHNDYLSVAVELGLTGLALWVAVLTGLVAIFLRAARVPGIGTYALAGLAVMVTLVGISVADNVMLYTAALYYIVALAGGVAALTAAHKRAQGRV